MSSYLLRGAAVAMSEFALVYVAAWAAVTALRSSWTSRHVDGRISSDAAYALLLTPFVTSSLFVIGFAIPSFLRYEPVYGEEDLGPAIVLLAVLCIVFLAGMVRRVTTSLFRTWRFTRLWSRTSVPIGSFAGMAAVRIRGDAPALTITGLLRPTIYISSAATNLLTESELALAIEHEVAHARRHDNVKKLIMRCCCLLPVPALERRWLALIEIDADAEAVSSHHEALDLASALVKASRISAGSPDLVLPFASDAAHLLRIRVERLLSWERRAPRSRLPIICCAISLLAGCLLLLPCYPTLLLAVHEFSEILVRWA